jgi:hypothetical protein
VFDQEAPQPALAEDEDASGVLDAVLPVDVHGPQCLPEVRESLGAQRGRGAVLGGAGLSCSPRRGGALRGLRLLDRRVL